MPDVNRQRDLEEISTGLSGLLKAVGGFVVVASPTADYMPFSAELAGLANLSGAAQGFVSHEGGGSWAPRTFRGTTNQINVAFGDGTVGDPVFSTPQDLHTAASPSFTQVNLGGDPVSALQAATKQYVDAVSIGLDVKASVRAASTANVALSGGATLTIDGVSLANGNRVLLKDQTTGSQNGIYTVSGIGTAYALTRATDADTSAEVTSGLFTFVTEGTINDNRGYVLATADPITIGTTSLSFVQFSSAGAGLNIGDSIGSGTAGSVLYLGTSGILAQDNANFFYDQPNMRWGFGTNLPSRMIHVKSPAANSVGPGLLLDATASGGQGWMILSGGGALTYPGTWSIYDPNIGEMLRGDNNGQIGIGRALGALLAQYTVYIRTAAVIGEVIRLASGQTANALEVQDNSGTVLGGFDASGRILLATLAGTPTGTPPNGTAVYDTTANKLWVYNGGWKSIVLV